MSEIVSTFYKLELADLENIKYTAKDIALYILHECIDKQHPISNWVLQYMLTLVQTKSLIQRHEPLFEDDIYVMDIGPGVPNVYRLFLLWGGQKITYVKDLPIQNITPSDIQFINDVICSYWEKLPWEMYDIMLGEDTAYNITKEKFGENAIISYDTLKLQDKLFEVKEDREEHLDQSVKKLIRKE